MSTLLAIVFGEDAFNERTMLSAVMFLIMGCAFSTIIVIGYWQVAPYSIVTEQSGPLTVYTPVVKQAAVLRYGGYACKSTNEYSADISREFVQVDDAFSNNELLVYPFPPVVNYADKGCKQTTFGILVPAVPPGMYKLHVVSEFQVNPLRTLRYQRWSQAFQIVER